MGICLLVFGITMAGLSVIYGLAELLLTDEQWNKIIKMIGG